MNSHVEIVMSLPNTGKSTSISNTRIYGFFHPHEITENSFACTRVTKMMACAIK